VEKAVVPRDAALPFGSWEATIADRLYRKTKRARLRKADLAIAATSGLARLGSSYR